jgi:hypothetical protein
MPIASSHRMVRMNKLHNPRPESEPSALEARWKVWKFVHVSGMSIGSFMTVKGEHPSTARKCRPHASSEIMRSISMWMLSPQTMSYAPRDICNRSSSSSLSLIVTAPAPLTRTKEIISMMGTASPSRLLRSSSVGGCV